MLCSREASAAIRRRSPTPFRARSIALADPRRFGRGPAWLAEAPEQRNRLNDDVKLFATTFAGGFLFVSLLIA